MFKAITLTNLSHLQVSLAETFWVLKSVGYLILPGTSGISRTVIENYGMSTVDVTQW